MGNSEINIRHFKLMSGEEIIGLVTQGYDNTDPATIVIERPFKIVTNMLGGIHFTPWFPFSTQKLYSLNKKTIVHDVKLDEDVAQEYIKIATSDAPAVKKVSMKSTDDMYTEMEELIEDFDDEIHEENKTIH